PQFDPAAVNAALSRARDADFALRAKLESTIVDFARDLPQAERQDMARALSHGGPLRHPPTPPATPLQQRP
ncbi:MAG: periplasmic heavy metal sensor, partial [Caulobacteraceae bacterium]